MLKKLAEAREAQASAMSRFIQARARVMQVEARLQSLRARLDLASTTPDQSLESILQATDATTIPDIQKPDATPAAQVIIPLVNLPSVPASSATDRQAPALVEQSRSSILKLSHFAEQATSALEESSPAPDDIALKQIDEDEEKAKDDTTQVQIDEDEEETKKMPSLRPSRSASSTQKNPGEEEALITTLSTLTKSEQSDEAVNGNQTRETSASDSTAKIPVIRQEHGQDQEPQ